MKYTIGIIGGGFVGSATALLQNEEQKCLIWDIDQSKRQPPDLSFENFLSISDIFFICVPTPMNIATGECNTTIVEKVISQLKPTNKNIYVRSTVPVGFCEKWQVNFMPEFLTEKNWKQDFFNCQYWILGNNSISTDTFIKQILTNAKNSKNISSDELLICTTNEAEFVKYGRNTFLATKISFFNELENFCNIKKIDYNNVSKLITLDSRIGSSHTQVPGYDGMHGFGGTCLPKDLSSLINQFNSHNVPSFVLKAVQDRNNKIDRTNQDWKNDIGRAVSDLFFGKYTKPLLFMRYNAMPTFCDIHFDVEYHEVKKLYTPNTKLVFFDKIKIFVKTDRLNYFITDILPLIKCNFYLFTGVSDFTPTSYQYQSILNSPFLLKWIAANNENNNVKIINFPIGFTEIDLDTMTDERILNLQNKKIDKISDKIFLPYHGDTNSLRIKLYHMLKNNSKIINVDKLSIQEYYDELSKYKFCFGIFGNGIDIHRIYECIAARTFVIYIGDKAFPLIEELGFIYIHYSIMENFLEDEDCLLELNKLYDKIDWNELQKRLTYKYWSDIIDKNTK